MPAMLRSRTWTVLPLILMVSALVSAPTTARGEHAVINLQVIGAQASQEAPADQEPPAGGLNARPKLTVATGDSLVLHFILTNVYPHGVVKDVTIRYFVVRTDKFGQIEVPDLEKNEENVVTQGRALLNLNPRCRVGARLNFRIEQPGIYLVRVDTLNTKSDHEHFSAIDLEVK